MVVVVVVVVVVISISPYDSSTINHIYHVP